MSGFGDILGHDRPLGVLRRAMKLGKVAHAYLFAGPPGVGKHKTALAFAAALNCRLLPDDACGQCPSCRKMEQGNHPDFAEIVKPEDKTAIVIDQIRELSRSLQYAPYEGRFRVCVFDGAEQMTTEAANALLKTLEEPGPQRVFVLVTPSPQLLPPTVVSRCQTLRFSQLPEEIVRAWAAEHLTLEQEDLDLVAALAEGSIGGAAAMDVAFLRGPRLALLKELAGAPNDAAAALALAERLLEVDPDLRAGLDLLAGFVRDAVLWRLTGDPSRLRNRDAPEAVAAYAGRMTTDALSRKIRALTHARRLNERNVARTAIAGGLCLELVSPTPTAFAKGRLPR